MLLFTDFLLSTRTTDLEKVLVKFKDCFVIRWVNGTTTLAIFKTPPSLDVYIDVPNIIHIDYMRSKSLQLGEELLPDGAPTEEDCTINPNEDIVNQLVSMGFQYLNCQKAAIKTSNVGVEEAMNWLLNHMTDLGR